MGNNFLTLRKAAGKFSVYRRVRANEVKVARSRLTSLLHRLKEHCL
jgi:hypothetical protein